MLLTVLAEETFPIETQNVQDTWNQFENILINITDKLDPMKTIVPGNKLNVNEIPITIKRKINVR